MVFADLSRGKFDRRLVSPLLCLLAGIVVAIACLGPLTKAKFGPIDDHEVVSMFGAGNRLPLVDLPKEVLKTEVGQPGKSGRYRPVLYTVRALEAWLFGSDAGAYYVFRIALFAFLTAGLLWVGAQTIGPFAGAAFTLFIMGLPFWHDLWPRLAANEQYGSAGLTLFLIGAVNIVRDIWARKEGSWNASFACAGIGLVIAAGSKENFIYMSAPLILLGAMGVKRGALRWWSLAIGAVGVAMSAFVAGSVAVGVLSAGMDLHGNSAGSRGQAFGKFIAQFLDPSLSPYPYKPQMEATYFALKVALVAALFEIIAIAALWRFRPPADKAAFARKLRFVLVIDAFALVWFFWEIIFYGGDWPTGMRYEFPGVLIIPAVLGSGLVLLRDLLPGRMPGIALTASTVALTAWAAFSVTPPLFTSLNQAVAIDVDRTTTFNGDLDGMAKTAATHSDWPVIVEVGQPMDYESSLTLPIWLRWKGVTNPLFLRVHEHGADGTGDVFMGFLYNALSSNSTEGGHGFVPLSQLSPDAEKSGGCFTVSYTGPASPSCAVMQLRR